MRYLERRFSENKQFCERYEKVCNKIEENSGIKEGAHVRYIGIDDDAASLKHPHYCGCPSDPRGKLDIDAIYEIEYRLIARSFSVVKLVGFAEDVFSPAVFEAIDKNEEKKCLKAGGRVRYIGKGSVLNFGTVYEVAKTGKHSLGIGFDDLELVGFEGRFDRMDFEKVKSSLQ